MKTYGKFCELPLHAKIEVNDTFNMHGAPMPVRVIGLNGMYEDYVGRSVKEFNEEVYDGTIYRPTTVQEGTLGELTKLQSIEEVKTRRQELLHKGPNLSSIEREELTYLSAIINIQTVPA